MRLDRTGDPLDRLDAVAPRCLHCSRVVFTRLNPDCEHCGQALPESLVGTAAERATRQAELQRAAQARADARAADFGLPNDPDAVAQGESIADSIELAANVIGTVLPR